MPKWAGHRRLSSKTASKLPLRCVAVTAVFGALAADVRAQSTPEIRHAALACLARNQFTLLTASIIPGDRVRVARIYFRSNAYPDFYFVEMRTASDTFQAILPKPNFETTRVIYYVEVVDDLFNSTRTAENDVEVTETEDQCRRRDPGFAYFTGADPRIAVGATRVGALAIPPGFLADGIVRFISAAGVAAGAGGGLSTGATLGFAAGAAAAAGLGVGILNAGQSTTSSSTTTTSTRTTTTITSTTTTVPGALVACFITLPDPPIVTEGEPITFDGRCSEPRESITTYQWELGDGRLREGPFIVVTYQAAGTYDVTLRVRDGARSAATGRAVRILPKLKACFQTFPDPPVVKVGELITLDGNCSEPRERIRSFQWDLGDGRSGTGPSLTRSYPAAGTYNVSLTVSDGTATDTTTRAVSVVALGADFEVTLSILSSFVVGEPIRYEARLTNRGPGSFSGDVDLFIRNTANFLFELVSFNFPFCDASGAEVFCSTPSEVSAGQSFNVVFDVTPESAGTLIVTANATCNTTGQDPDPNCGNNVSETPGIIVDPAPEPLTACFQTIPDPPVILVRETITFDGSCSTPSANIETYNWDLGDGRMVTAPFFSTSYILSGIYTVTLTVRGGTDSDSTSKTVTVQVPGPTLRASQRQPETSFTSHLVVPQADARVVAQVHLNSVRIDATDNSIPFRHQFRGNIGENTVEGHLVSEIASEALWRFDFTDASEFVPGSIKVTLGQTVSVGSRSVAFRLSGAPGQQLRFTYRLRR